MSIWISFLKWFGEKSVMGRDCWDLFLQWIQLCECDCPFFIFCLFLAFQRKVRILTTQKSLTTMHLVNFYKWFQSTTLSDHLSFFCLLGISFNEKAHINFFESVYKIFGSQTVDKWPLKAQLSKKLMWACQLFNSIDYIRDQVLQWIVSYFFWSKLIRT